MKSATMNPNDLVRSHLNERTNQEVSEDSEIVDNIDSLGLNSPPIVHETYGYEDYESAEYAVAVGWRRVLACQLLEKDAIPVRIRDDTEAVSDYDLRMMSISDNIRTLEQDTPLRHRAKSVKAAKNEGEKTSGEMAAKLGISRRTFNGWMEPYQWDEETIFHPSSIGNEMEDACHLNPDEGGLSKMKSTRQAVGGGELGVRALEYVERYGLATRDIRGAKNDSDSDYEFFDILYFYAQERAEDGHKHMVEKPEMPPKPASVEVEESDEVEVEESEPEETETIEVSTEAKEKIEEKAHDNDTTTTEVLDAVTSSGTSQQATTNGSMEESGETQVADIEEVPDAGAETYAPASIDDDLSEEQKERFERIEREHEKIINHESTVELGELKDNWDAYGHAINHIDRATCPNPDCDHGIEHLTWDCHGYNLREAFQESQRVYQAAIDNAPEIGEILDDPGVFRNE